MVRIKVEDYEKGTILKVDNKENSDESILYLVVKTPQGNNKYLVDIKNGLIFTNDTHISSEFYIEVIHTPKN